MMYHLDVDMNRNFAVDFNRWNADPSNDTYGGKRPFDQPLTQCFDSLFTRRKPDFYLDLHSGMDRALFYQ